MERPPACPIELAQAFHRNILPLRQRVNNLIFPEERQEVGRRSKGGLADDGVPASLPVDGGIKVIASFDVHGFSRLQAKSAAHSSYPFRAEHLTHVNAGKMSVEALHGAAVHSKLYSPIGIRLH